MSNPWLRRLTRPFRAIPRQWRHRLLRPQFKAGASQLEGLLAHDTSGKVDQHRANLAGTVTAQTMTDQYPDVAVLLERIGRALETRQSRHLSRTWRYLNRLWLRLTRPVRLVVVVAVRSSQWAFMQTFGSYDQRRHYFATRPPVNPRQVWHTLPAPEPVAKTKAEASDHPRRPGVWMWIVLGAVFVAGVAELIYQFRNLFQMWPQLVEMFVYLHG